MVDLIIGRRYHIKGLDPLICYELTTIMDRKVVLRLPQSGRNICVPNFKVYDIKRNRRRYASKE